MNKDLKKLLKINIGTGVKPEQIALLCNQYHVILNSGINVNRCTKLVMAQTENEKLKEVLTKVYRDIEGGLGLGEALEKNGKNVFAVTFIETIKAGEKSGDISGAFNSMSNYYKNQSQVKKKIKSALIYPAFVLFISIVVLIVIMVYVMPKLLEIFESMDGSLPLITVALIKISDFFSNNLAVIISALILIPFLAFAGSKTSKGKRITDYLKIRIPLIGKAMRKNYQSEYAATLAMLLKSGVVLSSALKITSRVIDNCEYQKDVLEFARRIESGMPLGSSMKNTNTFDNVLCEMTVIGEETGELQAMLETCAGYYNEEAENIVKKILASLEPAVLIFTAALAGFIAFAIYIPLFGMYELF